MSVIRWEELSESIHEACIESLRKSKITEEVIKAMIERLEERCGSCSYFEAFPGGFVGLCGHPEVDDQRDASFYCGHWSK